jgi:2-dehydro-3-deoxygalactonokinase
LQPFCAAVDWGTTNLRVWLLSPDGAVLGTRRGPEGLLSITDRGFAGVLETHLSELGATADLPVVICGMAGARTGWVEAPYVETPAKFDALAARAVRVAEAKREVFILPGICQRANGAPDVMRGEETQLLGASLAGAGDGLFCLPGTHSKWARVEASAVTGFSTFMTGELFELLRSHSVLAQFASASRGPLEQEPAFGEAIRSVLADPRNAFGRLFAIRAAALLDNEGELAAARLSGLLIGAEIAAAIRERSTSEIRLVASGPLAGAYSAALKIAGYAPSLLDPETLAIRGLFKAARMLWPANSARTNVA